MINRKRASGIVAAGMVTAAAIGVLALVLAGEEAVVAKGQAGTKGKGGKIMLPATSPTIQVEHETPQGNPASSGAPLPAGVAQPQVSNLQAGTAPVDGGVAGDQQLQAAGRAAAPGRARVGNFTIDGTQGWRFKSAEGLPLATPAIAHGKIYFGGGYGSHAFYAVDAVTGKPVWQIATDDDGPTAAVVEGNDVLFNTESCTLYCADALTGKIRWKKWLGDPLMNQPAAWEGKVYMAYPDKRGQHRVTCMTLQDGKELWNQPINGDIITAPVIAGGAVYLSALDGTVYAFEANTGKKQWSEQYYATSAPWIHDRQVYVSRRQASEARPAVGHGGQEMAAAPMESVAQLEVAGGRVAREQARRSDATYLTEAYNSRQKKAREFEAQDSSVGFGSAPAAAKLAQAQTNLGLRNVASVWAFQGSRPCVYRDRLYTSQHDVLRCTDAKSGKQYWEANFTDTKRFPGGRALTPPSPAGDAVYVATATGQVFCLDWKSGKLKWDVEVGEGISFQPSVMQGRVYVATDNGSVVSLDARDPRATGCAMWGGNAQHNGWNE